MPPAKSKKQPQGTPVSPELRAAAQENFRLIESTHWFLVLFNEHMIEEVIPLIQMGLAVYLDKPIVLLVPKGATIPMNLRRLALDVAEFDRDDPGSMETAMAQLHRTLSQ
jgi:hypothetical protein